MTAERQTARSPVGITSARRAILTFGVALLALGAFSMYAKDLSPTAEPLAFDFSINWVGAQRLVEGRSLYDAPASQSEAIREVGERMRFGYDSVFDSYIGPPVTALFHVPLLLLDRDTALATFRALALVGMIGALAMTAATLRPGNQIPAAMVGVGAFLLLSATMRTFNLGQAHELVMLALALVIWGAAREKWGIAGIGLGVAVVLKMSPVLLLLYLLLHRKWRAVWSAIATAVALSVAAALVGQPDQLLVWMRDIAPRASNGTSNAYNQSLPAWLARVFHTYRDVVFRHESIGGWHVLGMLFGIAATLWLWRRRRGRGIQSLDLGVLILVVLVAGPLTWDHYAVWALIPLVLVADPCRWSSCTTREVAALIATIATAILFLAQPIDFRWAASLGNDLASRIASGPSTVGILLLLGAALFLLRLGERSDQQLPDETAVEPGSTRYTAASSLTATS